MKKKNLKIALFSPNQNPYSETFVQAHKNNLKDKVYYYYGKGDNIKLEKHPPLASKLTVFFLKTVKNLFNKNDSYIRTKLVSKSLKKHKIDVALVEYGVHAQHLLPIIKHTKLPLVVYFHGYDASVKKILQKHDNYKELFEIASKIIVVSRVMEAQLLQIGCPKTKLVYNANAAQVEFMDVVPTFSNENFVSIGRFTDKKAPYYNIMAFRSVIKKYPKAKLLLAGDGYLLDVCKNLVKYYKLENNIEFLGVISPNEFIGILRECRGLIQHSITSDDGNMEGMPIAVLEASSAGVPVISTYHAGIPEVVIHGKTGLLSKEHDVDAMAENIMKLLDNLFLAKEMGVEAKKHIEQNFSMDKHIKNIQDVLEQLY